MGIRRPLALARIGNQTHGHFRSGLLVWPHDRAAEFLCWSWNREVLWAQPDGDVRVAALRRGVAVEVADWGAGREADRTGADTVEREASLRIGLAVQARLLHGVGIDHRARGRFVFCVEHYPSEGQFGLGKLNRFHFDPEFIGFRRLDRGCFRTVAARLDGYIVPAARRQRGDFEAARGVRVDRRAEGGCRRFAS